MVLSPGTGTIPGPRVGVEEEYLTVDPVSRQVVPGAPAVVAAAAAVLGEQVSTELTQFQVEAKTPPCTGLVELREHVRSMRDTVAAAAEKEGVRIIAVGAPPTGGAVPVLITADPRYAVGDRRYAFLHEEQSICSAHVHVQVPDRDRAVRVGNHLRPWLPALTALTANSPFWSGRDTGYASCRTLAWGRWPVAGAPPYLESAAEYDALVATLLENGTLVDPATVYWDIRPSARLPTLEVRVADVPLTAVETMLLAGLVRAAVAVALERVERGEDGPRVSAELLRAASWRAARDGLEGQAIDPATGRLVPATARIHALLEYARPALADFGDLDRVTQGVAELIAAGDGATRQRAVWRRGQSLTDVVDHLVERTTADGLG